MLLNRFLLFNNFVLVIIIPLCLLSCTQNKKKKAPPNIEVNPVGAWHLSNFENKNTGFKENNMRIMAIYEQGFFELYQKVPSEITAASTLEDGERIFYDYKVKDYKVRKAQTGEWQFNGSKNQLVFLIEQNLLNRTLKDFTLNLQPKYDTLIYANNDSLSFHFSKINK